MVAAGFHPRETDMTTLAPTLSLSPISRLLALWPAARTAAAPKPPVTADDTRARADFILDMLDRSPSAFGAESDVYGMMSLYGGRY
jgi:hypothetical protein